MSAITNLNYIRKIWRHPCATPSMSVMLETALPAAAMAVMEVFTFGCRDIQKMRAGKAPWHSRALKGLLGGATAGFKIGPQLWGFSVPFMALDAGLQYLLYADAITGFIANWTSLIYQEQGCKSPSAGYLKCGLTSTFQDAGGPYPVLIDCLENRACLSVGGNAIQIHAGCTATISWKCRFEPFLGLEANNGNVETWLEDVSSGERISPMHGYDQTARSQTTGGGHKFRNPAPSVTKSYVLRWRCSAGLMGCVSGDLEISSYGRNMPLVPTGCKPKDYDPPYAH